MSIFNNINNEPGIYEIYNKINCKRYIGQSINVRTRLLKHRNFLNKNKHQNNHLQNSWNKHGEDNFEFRVLEYCIIEDLDKKEDFYIYKFKSNDNNFGFNYRVDNKTNRGLKWSDNQRQKMMKAIESNPWYHNHTIPRSTMEKAWEASRNRVWTQEERDRHSKILTGTKVADTSKMKLAQQGENNPACKLSEESVKEIIMLLKNDYCTTNMLAVIYGVSYSSVALIRKNKSWKCIDRDNIQESYFIKGVDKVDKYCREHKTEIKDTAI